MKNRYSYVILLLLVFLSACVEVKQGQRKLVLPLEVWSSAQKQEFLAILQNDKYFSICHNQALYQKAKASRSSSMMTAMLLAYSENLANSCINLKGFESIQRQRKANGFASVYETYLEEVDKDSILLQLKAGMSIENILSSYVPENEQFAKLSHAYRAFSHASTLSQKQLDTLRLNIERIKLMNDNLGEDYILVNVPEYMVRVKRGKQRALKFKVVVGQRNLQTPIFAERLKYVTLNPQWSVPDSIARNEIIPAILKDPSYLKRHRLVIRKTYDLESAKLNPSKAELQSYRGGKGFVPFKFIEVPSRRNALGRVKFIFPNKHSVYMHDTQMKKLFSRPVRCFSHGCVRLEKPSALLSYVTINYTDKTMGEVNKWYKSMKTHYLKLNKTVMVHTAYHTAYIKENGSLAMFDDVYAFDKYQRLTF